MLVKTRFAPSPTGSLHVGSVRTALFSWLYAQRHNGVFILRIEDTDTTRSTAEFTQAIINSMEWLGLQGAEGPFNQSERYARYLVIAEQLIKQKLAYRCDCSKDRLANLRAYQLMHKEKPRYDGHCRNLERPWSPDSACVIRFKTPETGVVSFDDQVYGTININNTELDDLILMRSDGHPTYNFAVVVDDWDMGITHVIRGDDHVNNTPKQINILRALRAPIPVYAHVPMILGIDGKRLSKRHGAVGVLQFKEMGYMPQALLNYLVRLGWSAGDQEIFSMQEMINQFDLQHIQRAPASFDYEKLQWLNHHYLRASPPSIIVSALAEQFTRFGIDITHGPALVDVVAIFVGRSKTINEIFNNSIYLYTDIIEYDPVTIQTYWQPALLEPLTVLYTKFTHMIEWQSALIHNALLEVQQMFAIKMGQIAQPIRIAVTGSTSSPSIDVILQLLGKDRTLKRLEYLLQYLKTLPNG